MSATTPDLTKPTGASASTPAWIASGILGLALGAAAMYLGLKLNEDPIATKRAAGGGGPPAGGMGNGMGGMPPGMHGRGGPAALGPRATTQLINVVRAVVIQ